LLLPKAAGVGDKSCWTWTTNEYYMKAGDESGFNLIPSPHEIFGKENHDATPYLHFHTKTGNHIFNLIWSLRRDKDFHKNYRKYNAMKNIMNRDYRV